MSLRPVLGAGIRFRGFPRERAGAGGLGVVLRCTLLRAPPKEALKREAPPLGRLDNEESSKESY